MRKREQGVAVITALLLTTLAITIVASLFWQQQVQVRSIENQRLQLQKQWVLLGALDWSRLILREDARNSSIDHLGEPWAVPLAETRLDEYVDKSQQGSEEASDATLSGSIVDAQSRFNLSNLCRSGVIDDREVAVFARLLSAVNQDPGLAQATAELMSSAQTSAQDNGNASSKKTLDILYVDDLLAVPNFTPEALAAIKDFIVVIPGQVTQINVNTAPPEVLSARIATLSPSDAQGLVASRDSAWFKDLADFKQRMQGTKLEPEDEQQLSVSTGYFLVNGTVHLNRAGMQMQSLVQRSIGGPANIATKVIWIRES